MLFWFTPNFLHFTITVDFINNQLRLVNIPLWSLIPIYLLSFWRLWFGLWYVLWSWFWPWFRFHFLSSTRSNFDLSHFIILITAIKICFERYALHFKILSWIDFSFSCCNISPRMHSTKIIRYFSIRNHLVLGVINRSFAIEARWIVIFWTPPNLFTVAIKIKLIKHILHFGSFQVRM